MISNNYVKEQLYFIIILKALACFLITNSHCNSLYPAPFYSIGGGFGNALFFLCSGYLLAFINDKFGVWFKKRIIRLIPETIIMLILSLIIERFLLSFYPESFIDILLFCINRYWFITAIIIYYPLFFLVFYNGRIKRTVIVISCWIVLYIVLYVIHDKSYFFVEEAQFAPFKVFFYFGVFILGGLIRLLNTRINIKKSIAIPLMLVSLLIWTAEYAMIYLYKCLYSLQFLIHFSVITFSTLLFVTLMNYMPEIKAEGTIWKSITVISRSTLEIYLVQLVIRQFFVSISFPFNVILFFVCAFTLGIIYHVLYSKIINELRG